MAERGSGRPPHQVGFGGQRLMSAVFFCYSLPQFCSWRQGPNFGAHYLGQIWVYSCVLAFPSFLPWCRGSATVKTTARAAVVNLWDPWAWSTYIIQNFALRVWTNKTQMLKNKKYQRLTRCTGSHNSPLKDIFTGSPQTC